MYRAAVLFLLLIFFLWGCASKKVMPSSDDLSGQVSSEPMTFEPQGSDSKKIDGLNTIHFAFDSSILDQANQNLLASDAQWIKKHQNVKVQIEGHCDLVGTTEYNLALGDRRAKAASNYLIALGVAPSQLSTISFGKEKPLELEMSPAEQALNRRVNFLPIAIKNETASPMKLGSVQKFEKGKLGD
jgi:peptidoglycan-associated lipoprotein